MDVQGNSGLASVAEVGECVHCVVLNLTVILTTIVCKFSGDVAVNVRYHNRVA